MIPVDTSWRGFGGLHGGLVAAWLLEAATTRAAPSDSPAMRPAAITVSFVRPVDPSVPASVEADPLHRGRTTAMTLVRLSQGGRICSQATVTSGAVSPGVAHWEPGVDLAGRREPTELTRFLPPPEVVEFAQHVDIRPLTSTTPGSRSAEPRYEAWVRLCDPAVAAELGPTGTAALLLDAMPPGLLALWPRPRPVPTVELTIHFAATTPEPAAWHHIGHETLWADASTCIDQTELRTGGGLLVAVARQTRRIVEGDGARR
jgi:acyl-CoA thioesterase